jgi:hypothetical protein
MDNNDKLKKYLEHHDAMIYTSYTDEDNCSFHIYREDTADGYEVFIAKYKQDTNINIMDDLHYYTNDLFNVVLEKVQEGETIYVDDDVWNDMYMEDDFAELYDNESEEWRDEE